MASNIRPFFLIDTSIANNLGLEQVQLVHNNRPSRPMSVHWLMTHFYEHLLCPESCFLPCKPGAALLGSVPINKKLNGFMISRNVCLLLMCRSSTALLLFEFFSLALGVPQIIALSPLNNFWSSHDWCGAVKSVQVYNFSLAMCFLGESVLSSTWNLQLYGSSVKKCAAWKNMPMEPTGDSIPKAGMYFKNDLESDLLFVVKPANMKSQ